MSRTVITGGTVVSATGSVSADVLVDGETIVALAAPGSDAAAAIAAGATRVIDASGRLVVPGGLDVHTHMEMPFGGTLLERHFRDREPARPHGAGRRPSSTSPSSVAGRRCATASMNCSPRRTGNCAVDYGFHMIVSDVNEQSLKEMDILVDEGVTSFKLFMAYPGVFYSTDGDILRAMQQAAVNGATIMMHAENGIAIDLIVAETIARGETDPRFHALSRPLRSRARPRTARSSSPASRARRSTSSTSPPPRRWTRSWPPATPGATSSPRRVRSTSSFPTQSSTRPGFEGAKYVCSPPLRPERHLSELWRGLRTNDLSVVSTDHCPFCFKEQKELGRGRLHQDPERPARRREPGRPHLSRCRSGRHLRRALGRAHRHHAGSDVRALPAQRGHRAGGRRGHRRLRPGCAPDDLGRDAPHERRLLDLRGHGDHGKGRDRPVRVVRWSSRAGSSSARRATDATSSAARTST